MSVEREMHDEIDRYDFDYPPDAEDRHLAEADAASEAEDLRRELEREEHRGYRGGRHHYR